MSMFHFIDNKRKSNTTLGQLGLLEHWKNPVLLLMKKQNPVINGVVEIYLTMESLNKRVALLADKSEYSYCQTTCIQAVDAALHIQCEGMSIQGLAAEELYITRQELEETREPVEAIIAMMKIISQVADKKSIYPEVSRMNFYLLGHLPNLSAQEEEDIDLIEDKKTGAQAVKVFIREEHAKEANTRNFPICKYRFAEIASYMQNRHDVVIEPYEDYHVLFSKEELYEYVHLV